MARPIKEGMDYFPHDTDAVNDEKIEALRALYGNDGYSFYFILLERIYRSSSIELDVSTSEAIHILAQKVGVSDDKFRDMLQVALRHGLFDSTVYHERLVLTSNGIKRRASVVLEKRKGMQAYYHDKIVPSPISDAETTPETRQKPKTSDVKVVSSPVSDAETTPETPQSKEKESKVKESINKHFDTFWKAYPKKKSKGDAEKAFMKVNPDEELLATMLTAIERAKKSADWLKDSGQFIPHPATWLNRKCWEDEYPEKEADHGAHRPSPRRLPKTYRSPEESFEKDDG